MDRTYIIEPTLILRTGHVKKCTEIFALESLKINLNTIVVVPIGAPDFLINNSKIVVKKILPNSYEHILYDAKLFSTTLRTFVSTVFFFFPKREKDRIILFLDRFLWYWQNRRKMHTALQQLFKLEGINSHDRLILPNGDLLCVDSVIRILKRMGKNNSPKLSIRFINVMENAGIPRLKSKKSMLRSLRFLEQKNFSLRITAETENYRLFLAKYLAKSEICEYPNIPKKTKIRDSKKIVIGFLGSARPDKGFEKLKDIIPIVNMCNSSNGVDFAVQGSTTSWGRKYDETLNLLRQFPSTRILPGYISDEEMQEIIASCTTLLLPYDTETYAFRGSAMLFDAADLNVPLIVPAGTGMGATVRRFGIGTTFSEFSEIPSAINYVSQLSHEEISNRFSIYNDFRNSSVRKFLE